MSKEDSVESRARRTVLALVEHRISITDLDQEMRDFLGEVGSEAADILERIADEKLKTTSDEEDDSYYLYVAADMVRSIAVAALRPRGKSS